MASGEANTVDIEPMESCEEENLAVSTSSIHDTNFDNSIGYIEEIIMENEFQTLQQNFLEKHYKEFDDTEENKFVYTDIHKEYVNLVEKYLENELIKRLPDFSMNEFTKLLTDRRNELDGEIFEMLSTFTDFVAFKEMFLDYKSEKEGRGIDLSCGITVTSMGDLGLDGTCSGLYLSGNSF